MTAAAHVLAADIPTDEPHLTAILRAQYIHHLTGHAVWPWEVDDLPDEWLDAYQALAVTMPEAAKRRRSTNG